MDDSVLSEAAVVGPEELELVRVLDEIEDGLAAGRGDSIIGHVESYDSFSLEHRGDELQRVDDIVVSLGEDVVDHEFLGLGLSVPGCG